MIACGKCYSLTYTVLQLLYLLCMVFFLSKCMLILLVCVELSNLCNEMLTLHRVPSMNKHSKVCLTVCIL